MNKIDQALAAHQQQGERLQLLLAEAERLARVTAAARVRVERALACVRSGQPQKAQAVLEQALSGPDGLLAVADELCGDVPGEPIECA
ncbi:MAG TPA: hypothetical protein VFU47_16385 [Armatimonadota bacterium]|nr:hypothetical protein [Armatimonadota bacterium]